MRAHKIIHSETVIAASAIIANRFVTYGDVQASVLGEQVLGVSRTDAAIGGDLAVGVIGVGAVESGGAISRGDEVTTDAQGRVIALTDPSTQDLAGIALTGAPGVGSFPQILLK